MNFGLLFAPLRKLAPNIRKELEASSYKYIGPQPFLGHLKYINGVPTLGGNRHVNELGTNFWRPPLCRLGQCRQKKAMHLYPNVQRDLCTVRPILMDVQSPIPCSLHGQAYSHGRTEPDPLLSARSGLFSLTYRGLSTRLLCSLGRTEVPALALTHGGPPARSEVTAVSGHF